MRHEEKRRLRGGLLLLLTWKTVTLPVVALDPAPPMTPPFGVPFFQKARHLTTRIGIYLKIGRARSVRTLTKTTIN